MESNRKESNKMEIERINENTIKFYISYVDIEERGFERDEIWYDRERSEQLFWQMMEEVNSKEDFTIEGPLWIQVQALEKGLEIIVTRSQFSPHDEMSEHPLDDKEIIDLPVEERIEKLLESKFGRSKELAGKKEVEEEPIKELSFIFKFKEFEDVIQLSHYVQETSEEIEKSLYSYRDNYYLYVKFPEDIADTDDHWNLNSQILEFGSKSKISVHVLHEYGKRVFKDEALTQIRTFFTV